MKKYTLIIVALFGFTFATLAQTETAAVQLTKKEIRKAAKAEKKALKVKSNVATEDKVAVAEKPAKVEMKAVEEFAGNPETPITFDALVIERNNIKKGTDDMFSFTFRNTGVTPIIVDRVQTSCGCTTANKPDAPVQPGDKAEISVKYDTNRVGAFTKTITVYTNVGEPVLLTIKGSVLAGEGEVQESAPQH